MYNAQLLVRINMLMSVIDLIEQEKQISKSMQHEEKRAKANEIIKSNVGFAAAAGFIPFPGADLLAVSGVQLNMMRQLAKLYNIGFIDVLGKNVISAVVGTGVARIGASLVKAIPGVGTVIGEMSMPILAGASTYALGQVVASHFHKGGSLEDLDLRNAKKSYESEIEHGKRVAEELRKAEQAQASNGSGAMDKLKQLAELHKEGILTDEEFSQMKAKLLEQM
jgi:uncharacterized protein (DUF697 family)